MAFGFLGDIVEGLGDVILGPKGTRGASIGGAIGGAYGGPVGAAVGSSVGSSLSSSIASGAKGQEAVSAPTASQSPSFAPESALSSGGFPKVYQPTMFAGFPRVPNTAKDIATGIGVGEVMDIIPDINISKFFGAADPCAAKTKKLIGMRRDCSTGSMCPTVTRKQQATLRKMLEYLPIEEVAYQAGVEVSTLARLVAKSMPARKRGISGSQLSTAKRVNNQILNMAGKLGYNCTPKTKAQLGCK